MVLVQLLIPERLSVEALAQKVVFQLVVEKEFQCANESNLFVVLAAIFRLDLVLIVPIAVDVLRNANQYFNESCAAESALRHITQAARAKFSVLKYRAVRCLIMAMHRELSFFQEMLVERKVVDERELL